MALRGSDTVILSVMTTEGEGFAPIGPLLERVRPCETDTANCATTDADGMASIALPADQQVSYALEKDGYTPHLAADVTFDLIDETTTPFYFEQDWTPSFDLAATTSVGQGGFVEQATEEYQVEYGGTATNCSVQIGWTGDAPNRVKVPVRAGYLSFSTMVCDEP